MLKKVMKHIIRIFASIVAALILVTLVVQVFYYREKENTSATDFSFISEEDPIYFTAHRGVTSFAPENSLPAFEKATEMNYYAAECDIMLTKDNQWVLTHDDTMFLHFWSFKKVSESTYDELSEISYKNGVNFYKFKNMSIPTLDEYLDIFINSETKPQIEIKSGDNSCLDDILEKLENKNIKDKAIIISFNFNQLKYIREIDKNVELWYLTNEINETKIEECKSLGDNTKLAIKGAEVTDESILQAQNDGLTLCAWTINDADELERLYSLGIRYITTDKFCK